MRNLMLFALVLAAGCATVEPGHRGLLFRPFGGGLQRYVLNPGMYYVGALGRIDDFDVTYSTQTETLHTISSEGLALEVRISIMYRPIVEELYYLAIEIGANYYAEVIGPEFRTATRGVFAHHSYIEVQRLNAKVEQEIREEVRRRVAGRHVEVSSVTMEGINYAPEIADSIRNKLIGEQEAARKKVAQENEANQRKAELHYQAERAKLEAEAALLKKQQEHKLAQEQAAIDKVQAESSAAVRIINAKAAAEEKRAEASALTPLMVMMRAYDALAKLGGSGTHILLGDWSKVPNFLLPPSLLPALNSGNRP